jgi:hypothetical protein
METSWKTSTRLATCFHVSFFLCLFLSLKMEASCLRNISRLSMDYTVLYSRWYNSFFLIRIVGGGVQAGSTRHVGHWMAYCICPGWLWGWRIYWNEDWQGKLKYSEKTCPNATLSTTNPTWPDPGLSPGRHSGKPATNRLSYGAAWHNS